MHNNGIYDYTPLINNLIDNFNTQVPDGDGSLGGKKLKRLKPGVYRIKT